MKVCLAIFASYAVTSSTAFQIPFGKVRSYLPSSSKLYGTISIEEDTPRDIGGFIHWATHYGTAPENGFDLLENNGDFSIYTRQDCPKYSRVLKVPSHLIWNSQRIRQEELTGLDYVMQELAANGAVHSIPQFFLWLKILKEYEMGDASPWYPWMNSLPRKFSTAVSMDEFELECLPPFVASLAKIDRINFGLFRKALSSVPFLSAETKANDELTKWAFNIVFTRCWARENGECEIVPMADLLNHGHPADVEIQYDENNNCNVVVTHDLPAGSPLRLSYGMPTNPSRLLSTFGFLDKTPPATFCKIMSVNPSQELVNMGYDFARMVFYTEDGAIAEEVWDVVLYSLLEDLPEVRQALYEAHMRGDRDTKAAIHGQFFLETCNALMSHVDSVLLELQALSQIMEEEGFSQHPRLPMIRDHNEFVRQTFLKVKARLDQMIRSETERRDMVAQQEN